MRKPLEHEFSGETGVPARAARNDFHVAKSTELFLTDVHRIEEDFSGFLRNSAEQSVADRARLLEDFLLHEVLEATLLGHDRVPGDVLGRSNECAALEVDQTDSLRRQDGDFAVAKEEDAARVLENCGNVAGHKKLVFPEADDDGRPHSCGDNFVWIAR